MNLESVQLEAELSILWQSSALITGRGIFILFFFELFFFFISAEDLELAGEVSSAFGAKSGEVAFLQSLPLWALLGSGARGASSPAVLLHPGVGEQDRAGVGAVCSQWKAVTGNLQRVRGSPLEEGLRVVEST